MLSLPAPQFVARPRWQRILLRLWRRDIYSRLPGCDRRGIPRRSYRFVVPPRELDQETMDWAIKRGQELAKERGW